MDPNKMHAKNFFNNFYLNKKFKKFKKIQKG